METRHCPHCGKSTVILGQIVSEHTNHHDISFAPRHCRGFRMTPGIPLSGNACASCGHVWTSLDPGKLREFIASRGEEIARQELDEIDRGPYRDLPDTALAREIADNIAEIDALVREGKSGHVARYREMRGIIWDRAINETRNWSSLTRAEKLALFGWTPKEKAPIDDLA